MPKKEMQTHEPKCRLVRMVSGARFHIILNTRGVEVELICPSPLGGFLDEQPLENVVPASKVRSPHSTRFVHVSEASLRQFRPQLLQLLPPPTLHPPPVGIHPLLFRLPTLPLPPSSLRLRNVGSQRLLMHGHQSGSANQVIHFTREPERVLVFLHAAF